MVVPEKKSKQTVKLMSQESSSMSNASSILIT